jgi:intracellular sulfur oxidation DsrE/DsrF family protein
MSTRKDFIAVTSVFALTAGAPEPAGKNAEKSHANNNELTFDFDRARFNEILSKPVKHKQCFGVTNLSNGDALDGMNNSIGAYDDFLKEGPGAMQAVAVLYHGASIGFALSDSVWNELIIPSMRYAPDRIRKDIGAARPGKGNPFLRSAPGDPGGVSIESLVAKGASFFVCHNAIVGFTYLVARALKASPEKVYAQILAGIVPGALAVPAGVMAINACQEAKFSYISAG